MLNQVNICSYYGQTYLEKDGLWGRITVTDFKSICYAVFGAGIPASHVRDLEHYFMGSHNILPHPSELISFDGKIWDMDKCDFVIEPISKCFFRSSITPNMDIKRGNNQFIKDLACDDKGVYEDIFMTLAVMFSRQKPDMVGFFYGEGRNGKSVLIDVVNKIIGNHISTINLERLTDQRDAPLINGTLANLCGENADNIVIEDSQIFKSIGSHEKFSVHRMHTNDSIEIDTNPVHIFCVNNLPTFKDKSNAIIRRSRIIPFNNKFVENRKFRDDLLNDDKFMSDFLGEVLLYCQAGKQVHWVSDMSEKTRLEIEHYETLRNSAKAFISEYIESGLVGFTSFTILDVKYENWCNDNGFNKLGTKTFRKTVIAHAFKRRSTSTGKVYMLDNYNPSDTKFIIGLYYNTASSTATADSVVTPEILALF